MSTVALTGSTRATLIFLALLVSTSLGFLYAAGTPDLRSADGDPVMLLIGDRNFGQFAAIDGPEESRLNFRIARAGEVVYFGMSRLYFGDGTPQGRGKFEYQVRSAATGQIVFGPITITDDTENLTTYADAAAGPDALNEGGYRTDDRSTFVAPAAGVYYVEFSQARNRRARYIGLWDITVARDGVEQRGRVYSQNWAFRVPELDAALPECAFGAELSSRFYSYTADGFVTMIDFTDSGFQPLSFNLAFNRTGPGSTGDLLKDRQSVAEENLTGNSAEHLIFLEEPDADLFPDGSCGRAFVSGELRCQADDTYCVPITVSQPGQVEIVLDFNRNGRFDEGADRIMAYRFSPGDPLETCVKWDGFLPDGSRPPEGTSIDILVEYTQGVQHWALYDGEFMKNGFCVTPVRPICGEEGTTLLYYDDSNIPDDPGNGAPKRVLEGCECRTGNCRTWTNFNAFPTADCTVDNDETQGYGDRNTLNTWWFASSSSTATFDVPVDLVVINGPVDHCPGEAVGLTLEYNSPNVTESIRWSGPGGPLPAGNDRMALSVTESGLYAVVITDEFGCTSNGEYALEDVNCTLSVSVNGIRCSDPGTETDPRDDVWYAEVTVTGSNSAGWTSSDGRRGAYGETFEIGPLAIGDGAIQLTLTDGFYACCTETVTLNPPPPCSDGCAITEGSVTGRDCDDNGTDTVKEDDTFTFTMVLNGINLSDRWTNDLGQSGPYGEEVTFGPFDISAGDRAIEFWDSADPSCRFPVLVQAPEPCSDRCIITPKADNILCNDNDTPFDATDDTYTFELSVSGVNLPSQAYSIDGSGLFRYDQTYTVGPLRISGSDFTFVIRDVVDQNCSLDYVLEEPPVSCSDACGLRITDSRVVCDGNGTLTTEDDGYYVEIMVESDNPFSRSWMSREGLTGEFGVFTRVSSIPAAGGQRTVVISDLDDPGCRASVTATTPAVEITCPEPVSSLDYKMSVQSFGGTLSQEGSFEPADRELCWIGDETYSGGRRYHERLSLRRTDTTASRGPALFSCYLYGAIGSELRGGIFSLAPEEPLDCCNLTNEGPVAPQPRNLRSVPALPNELIPDGLSLQQSFSIGLRANENYSLVTSSATPGVTGDYVWLIVTASGEPLLVTKLDAPDPVSTQEDASLIFDLLDFQLPEFRNRPASAERFGRPRIDSVCGEVQIVFADEVSAACDARSLLRTFEITLSDTVLREACVQEIGFRALGLTDIAWPEGSATFGCNDDYPIIEATGHPAPAYTGYPTVYRGGVPVALDEATFENLRIAYEDREEARGDGGINIIRTWTVNDDCRQTAAQFSQLLKLEANGIPFFACPLSNHYCPIVEEDIMLWTTNPWNCLATIELPEPELNNICDSTGWTFVTEILRLTAAGDTVLYATLEEGDVRTVADVPTGDYLIHFIGFHDRLDIEDRYCRIRVADLVNPIAVCKSNVEISLPGSGVIRLPFRILDQGSYDNCGIEVRELRRRYGYETDLVDSLGWSEWSGALFFDCADVGFDLEVQVRVTDTSGNDNFCTSFVRVLDNTNPYCTGLDLVETNCDSLPNGFSAYDTTQLRMLFGMPDVVDNCSAVALELAPIVSGDDCAPDRIRRRFRALDQHGNLSTGLFVQDIYVDPSLSYAVQFPRDVTTDCTDLTDTVRVVGSGCDSITVEFVDLFLPTTSEAECRYVQRNFLVTNWCEWDGVSDPVVIGRDENCSGAEADADVWLVRTRQGIFTDADSTIRNDFPAAGSRGAGCGGPNPAGYWREVATTSGGRYRYSQRIRIVDNSGPEIRLTMVDTLCVDTARCRATVDIGIELFDACQIEASDLTVRFDLNNNGDIDGDSRSSGRLSGTYPDYRYSVNLPIGTHRLEIEAQDDCGNTSLLSRIITVHDCYVPFLYVNENRIYNLQPLLEEGDIDGDGIVEEAAVLAQARDLAACNFTDCSGQLSYSVNRVGEPFDSNQAFIYLDCEDRYRVDLEVYVWDRANVPFRVQPDGSVGGHNWRKTVVRILLQDPNLACNNCQVEDNITINGHVTSVSGNPVVAASVSAGNGEGASVTSNFGGYQVRGRVGGSYVLSVAKDVDPREGLSTIDLLIMKQHVLGVRPITNPFLLLAADLNRDGDVDAFDMVHLRGLILAREDLYPAGSPWRFVAADWDGRGTPPEEITLSNLRDCSFSHDFVGLRMGDMNDSYLGGAAGARNPEDLLVTGSQRPLELTAPDRAFTTGERLTVALTTADADRLRGGQLGLRWNPAALRLDGVRSADLDERRGFRRASGLLWMSWATDLSGPEIVTVTLRALADGRLSDLVELTPGNVFRAEAYNDHRGAHPLFLSWTAPAGTPPVAVDDIFLTDPESGLLGVLPNPTRDVARIGLTCGSDQRATLTVTDLSGRVLTVARPQLAAGEQWIEVSTADWPAGVYGFAVELAEGVLAGRIVRR